MKTALIKHYFVSWEVHWLTSWIWSLSLGLKRALCEQGGKNTHFGLKEVNGLMKPATNTNPISEDPTPLPPSLFSLPGYHATKTTNCNVRNLDAQYGLKLNW